MGHAGFGDRVEGLHAVAAATGRVETLFVERGRLRRTEYRALAETVAGGGGEVVEVDDVRPRAGTSAPQGVVAHCRPLVYSTLEGVAGAVQPAAVMVLDRVVDPHNLGAVARSVAAAGLGGLVVGDRRSAPLGPVALKAAAGAFERLAVASMGSVAGAVSRLQRLGLWVVGLDSQGERSLFGLDLLAEPVAVVVGGEGTGLSRLVSERVDVRAAIPMTGDAESLNASVAAALAAFEILRARV